MTQALPLDRKYLNRKYVRSFGEPIVKFLLRHLRCVKLQEEAYILFRRNQHLNDPDEIAKKVYSNSKHPLLKLCMLSLYIAIDPVSYRFLAQ